MKERLLSKGNTPYTICFGKEKENKPTTGTILWKNMTLNF